MTNPNNIVRVRARNGGRASVYEANDWAQIYSTGLFEGNGVIQNTSADMNVLVGGSSTKPDVIIAANPAGYKIALDIVGQQAIAVTAPASNSRISAIVAYTDDLSLSTEEDTVTGSPASCGLIVVNGDAAASPVAPDDTAIRTAITADGATGSQAAYVVLATILVASSTTAITNSLITASRAQLTSENIDFTTSTFSDNGVTYDTFGALVFGDIWFAPSSPVSVPATDASPYTITTLDVRPKRRVVIPCWAMNASNVTVSQNLFVEISTSGVVRIRNYTSTSVSVSRLAARFSFVAA